MTVTADAVPQETDALVETITWPARMPGRLKNKLAGFERRIAHFRQRRWS